MRRRAQYAARDQALETLTAEHAQIQKDLGAKLEDALRQLQTSQNDLRIAREEVAEKDALLRHVNGAPTPATQPVRTGGPGTPVAYMADPNARNISGMHCRACLFLGGGGRNTDVVRAAHRRSRGVRCPAVHDSRPALAKGSVMIDRQLREKDLLKTPVVVIESVTTSGGDLRTVAFKVGTDDPSARTRRTGLA